MSWRKKLHGLKPELFRDKVWEIAVDTRGVPPSNQMRMLWISYAKVLKYDKNWHFIYEGDFVLIRVSNWMLIPFLAWYKYIYCRKYQGEFKFTLPRIRPWRDENPVVRAYQDIFTPLFHYYTVLGLRVNPSDVGWVAERAHHILLLSFFYPSMFFILESEALKARPLRFEEALLEMLLKDRREYIEYYYRQRSLVLKVEEPENLPLEPITREDISEAFHRAMGIRSTHKH